MSNLFVSFVSSLVTDAVIQTVALQVSEECLLVPPTKETVIISKRLFPCFWYSVTFTKIYLPTF